MSNLLTYADDIRTVPTDENTRLPAFKTGWTEAVKHDSIPSKYRENPKLDTLTWENLGFRLGTLFGDSTPEMKEDLYEWCVQQQRESEGATAD